MKRAKIGPLGKFLFVLLCSTPTLSFANYYSPYAYTPNKYYGAELSAAIGQGLRDQQLKKYLNYVLKSIHVSQPNSPDTFVAKCPKGDNSCYQHNSVGYRQARKLMMGYLHLAQWNGRYVIRCVYCDRFYGNRDFPGSGGPGPGIIPNHQVLNAEHTWPQSKFSRRYPRGSQKSDLHHLYPTDSRMNSIRGNHPFGVVNAPTEQTCNTFKVGRVQGQSGLFAEPPNSHKGNVARALMYFSVRYEMPIGAYEEAVIRIWHANDPVDQEEVNRHEAIFTIQGNRNPFIDNPALVGMISDF